MAEDTLTVTDNRTGKTYTLPVTDGTVRAMDLRQVKVSDEDFGLMSYDPAFTNTASTRSRVTFIDGERGILQYRGYPIEQLAEHASFLEVAFLLIHGELPNRRDLDDFTHNITTHTLVHENIREFFDAFRYDAHPMGILISTTAALSTFYPNAKVLHDPELRRLQMYRLIAKMPTLAAYAYRHRRGLPYVYPDNDLSYAGNFLNMMFKMTEVKYKPNPAVEKALDVLFTLHADHEQNCSASAMRGVGSSRVDPFSAAAAACAALYGPLHGGANEAVVHMLQEIGSKENIPKFLKDVQASKQVKLMGFGHRVYKNYDPRAKVIKKLAYEVFDAVGKNPLI
ncbi:MAG: citrate (Si)-synthase, partial [Myxococcales bacterium]|nr:citrate (Si)-synthase [Myxococcales bacterium]